jgi:hypothetical protein
MIATLRRLVVVTLLAVWTFPAAGFADTGARAPEQKEPSPFVSHETSRAVETSPNAATPSASYAQREQQSRGVEDFRGGDVAIYLGGGALTILLIILLIVVLV